MPQKNSISFIVLNYNGVNVLGATLKAMLPYALAKDEIIVLDNNSQDDSVAFVQKNFPTVKIIALKENLVIAGLNEAVKHAKYDIIGLFNNDFIIQRFERKKILSWFESPTIFGISGQAVFKDGNLDFAVVKSSWKLGFFKLDFLGRGKPPTAQPSNNKYPSQITHTFSAVIAGFYDKAKFTELDGFDSMFYPAYWEDVDLGYRAFKRGWGIYYSPDLSVLHNQENRVTRTFGANAIKIIANRNKHLFIWKNFNSYKIVLQYLIALPFVLTLGTLRYGIGYLQGFMQAIPLAAKAIAKNRRDNKLRVMLDEEILEQRATL